MIDEGAIDVLVALSCNFKARDVRWMYPGQLHVELGIDAALCKVSMDMPGRGDKDRKLLASAPIFCY
jgi:hypothetical protein